jgi:hypothetical protein
MGFRVQTTVPEAELDLKQLGRSSGCDASMDWGGPTSCRLARSGSLCHHGRRRGPTWRGAKWRSESANCTYITAGRYCRHGKEAGTARPAPLGYLQGHRTAERIRRREPSFADQCLAAFADDIGHARGERLLGLRALKRSAGLFRAPTSNRKARGKARRQRRQAINLAAIGVQHRNQHGGKVN